MKIDNIFQGYIDCNRKGKVCKAKTATDLFLFFPKTDRPAEIISTGRCRKYFPRIFPKIHAAIDNTDLTDTRI